MGTRAGVFIIIHVKYRNRESTSQNPSEYIFDLASATLHRDNGPPPIWGQILPMPTKLSTWIIDLFFFKKRATYLIKMKWKRDIWWKIGSVENFFMGRWGKGDTKNGSCRKNSPQSALHLYTKFLLQISENSVWNRQYNEVGDHQPRTPSSQSPNLCRKIYFCNIFWRSVWAKKIPSPLNVYLLVF